MKFCYVAKKSDNFFGLKPDPARIRWLMGLAGFGFRNPDFIWDHAGSFNNLK
jgi:hypothetical protein